MSNEEYTNVEVNMCEHFGKEGKKSLKTIFKPAPEIYRSSCKNTKKNFLK